MNVSRVSRDAPTSSRALEGEILVCVGMTHNKDASTAEVGKFGNEEAKFIN